MTEITERRWQCDFCGNVSPVLDGYPSKYTGWVTVNRGELGSVYNMECLHFCTPSHRLAYEQNAEEVLE